VQNVDFYPSPGPRVYPEGGILIRGSTFRRGFAQSGGVFADSKAVASYPAHLRKPSRLPDRREDAPRLVLRFALYSGAVLFAAGLAILWTVDHEITARARHAVEVQGQTIVQQSLRGRLLPSDFKAPVRGRRLTQLDELFRREIFTPGVIGTRLVNRGGTITYAARHQLIGTKVPYMHDLAAVFAGMSKRRVTHTVSWRGKRNVKVLQSLVPVRETATTKPVGVFEFDQDYRALEIGIGDASHRLVLILTIAFLVLYLSLFPILHRLTGQLASRNRSLREQAAEREELLEAEQTARAEAEAIQRLLTEQNTRLRELDLMKDEFVSLVSHELRTPLTSIRGYLDLLLEEGGNLTPEQERFLGVVDRNSERLLDLVGDLLFLAQVDAGKLTIEREDVDFEQVVQDSVETLRPIAESRRTKLVTSIAPVPRLVGDRARLAQVLDNLLSNALKFTPEGGRVSVSLHADGDRAVVEVQDNGVGIPGAEQNRLFERFFRSSRATENAIPGTGLGLAITKAIAERHGGRISVESEEDVGTSVRVELPLATAHEQAARARELAAPATP
jgi:signal transduction histidine kinase